MHRATQRFLKSAAVLTALLLAFTIAGVAQVNWDAPPCPTEGRTTTFTFNEPAGGQGRVVTVTVPTDAEICPREDTKGCCDTIQITGLDPAWYLDGFYSLSYVYTTKVPPGEPNTELIYSKTVGEVAGADNQAVFKVCLPFAHSWKSFELHVDLSITVWTDANKTTKVTWIGQDPVNAGGVIGPGMDWDPVCYGIGCTPGYWKTHLGAWTPEGLPDQLFKNVFGRTPSSPNANIKMKDAAGLGGGGEKAMIRHCSAAYVGTLWKAANVLAQGGNCIAFTGATAANVIAAVQAGYDSGDFEAAHQYCAGLNENALCGPNGPWLGTSDGQYGGPACNPNINYDNTNANK